MQPTAAHLIGRSSKQKPHSSLHSSLPHLCRVAECHPKVTQREARERLGLQRWIESRD